MQLDVRHRHQRALAQAALSRSFGMSWRSNSLIRARVCDHTVGPSAMKALSEDARTRRCGRHIEQPCLGQHREIEHVVADRDADARRGPAGVENTP